MARTDTLSIILSFRISFVRTSLIEGVAIDVGVGLGVGVAVAMTILFGLMSGTTYLSTKLEFSVVAFKMLFSFLMIFPLALSIK